MADAQANSRPAKKRRDRCRWRDGTGPANFCLPGGQEHGAQRSVPVLWKRSFCSSGPDRNGTVSCRGHRRPTLQPPPSLGPTRSTLVASPASTPALACFPERLRVLPAPEIPANVSKPKGTPRKYQNGPSSCAGMRSGSGMGSAESLFREGMGIHPPQVSRWDGDFWSWLPPCLLQHSKRASDLPGIQPGGLTHVS